MQRRHFSTLAAASLGLGLTRLADAQGGTPVAGQDYKPVATPGNPTAPAGTVDVVEFFSYACPHCFEFEPTLESWLKKKPAGIHFHRLPVHFLQNYTNFQPMYFALEAMDVVDAKRFMSLFGSFGVRTKVQQANQLMEAYGVDGVPTIVVGGQFMTSPSLAKGEERTTQVVEFLAAKLRGGH